MKHIQWAAGYPAKINAEQAHAELEAIRRANGGELTAVVVVERARDDGSVLHRQVFDRSRRDAAEEYYKDRARLLVRSVMVRYDDGPDEPTRVYPVVREQASEVSPRHTAKVYGDVEEAMRDPKQREYILKHALADAARWRKKYSVLQELSDVFDAIDAALS